MESPTERAIYTVRYAIATMPIIQRGYDFEQAELYEMGWKRSVNTTLQTSRDTTADRD